MTYALPELIERGTTRHPFLTAIILAKLVNQASGGAVVSPWEVDELDETWLDAFRFLANDMQDATKVRQKVQAVKERWLAQHPTYGK